MWLTARPRRIAVAPPVLPSNCLLAYADASGVVEMLAFIIVVVLVVGLTTVLCCSVGLGPVIHGFLTRHRARPGGTRLTVDDVCVLVAAHNEEQVIEATVQSAHSLVPAGNVFVASDGSSDNAAKSARDRG